MFWCLKAADQGHAMAMFSIGYLYEHGLGVTRDFANAVRWYRKAVNNGYSDAKADISRLQQQQQQQQHQQHQQQKHSGSTQEAKKKTGFFKKLFN
ncbi:MAG: hypothetical protein J3R72DRAFT_450404 [Linnemannia gamsii]|nr:MAG: hypothetical protein J3R72DRAFT_450404 [Linnemannia gamsii]